MEIKVVSKIYCSLEQVSGMLEFYSNRYNVIDWQIATESYKGCYYILILRYEANN